MKDILPPKEWHFNRMQEVVGESIVRGRQGIDVGSGCGYDTYIMAKNNPGVRLVSMDSSEGIYTTKEITSTLNNVAAVRSSVLDMALKDNIFDFAYSFGVLHHTPDPEGGLKEIARVIKKGAPAYLYLYDDHRDNPTKYFILKIIRILRLITTRIPRRILYVISFLASPFVVIFFSYPARFFSRFKATSSFSEKIPFNFGKGLFSLTGDLYDRFGAPIEYRFSKEDIMDMLRRNGFVNIKIDRIRSIAGWVAWGYKAND
ncbi:MAG TPA: class I SAM-dependent methyltransferase [Candidatus Omnitrophica bacterium]|nr:class I SAM-dependent methyltransferase [Candidatus Omnitrophota bacterium]